VLVTTIALAQNAVGDFPIFRDVASNAGLTLINASGEGHND
jgi:hypothetical protein